MPGLVRRSAPRSVPRSARGPARRLRRYAVVALVVLGLLALTACKTVDVDAAMDVFTIHPDGTSTHDYTGDVLVLVGAFIADGTVQTRVITTYAVDGRAQLKGLALVDTEAELDFVTVTALARGCTSFLTPVTTYQEGDVYRVRDDIDVVLFC